MQQLHDILTFRDVVHGSGFMTCIIQQVLKNQMAEFRMCCTSIAQKLLSSANALCTWVIIFVCIF